MNLFKIFYDVIEKFENFDKKKSFMLSRKL